MVLISSTYGLCVHLSLFDSRAYQGRKSGDSLILSDALSEDRNLPAPHAHCVEQSFYVSFLAVDISLRVRLTGTWEYGPSLCLRISALLFFTFGI